LQQLRVVVALGNVAFDAVLRLFEPLRSRPIFAHGASYEVSRRIQLEEGAESLALSGRTWLIASYHPSRQNTQTGRLTSAMFDRVWELASSLL
jgi:uracil-DNA glycosylase